MRPLPYPPDAKKDQDSLEVIRGWDVKGKLQISLAAWVWSETPEIWGRFLADSACHLCDAISKEMGSNREEIYRIISKSLIDHLENPPENLVGDFVDPQE